MTKRLPSWRRIAATLYDALFRCDWSFGRSQDSDVTERIAFSMEKYDEKFKRECKRKVRKTSDSSKGVK
jgi:predicted phosphoadenosine phosphosulfate sulfurtransferase